MAGVGASLRVKPRGFLRCAQSSPGHPAASTISPQVLNDVSRQCAITTEFIRIAILVLADLQAILVNKLMKESSQRLHLLFRFDVPRNRDYVVFRGIAIPKQCDPVSFTAELHFN